MGLYGLEDFLEVASEDVDHVKITTNQILNSPEEWLKRKIKTYQKYKIHPYLDHTYFMKAYELGVVDKAIVLGKELGFEYIEFMSTYKDVTENTPIYEYYSYYGVNPDTQLVNGSLYQLGEINTDGAKSTS